MNKKFLILTLMVLSIMSIFIGVQDISIMDIINLNMDKINVVLISRLPRLIALIVAGVGMSISGVIMQQISNNKFVSPTTAATLDSAQFGVIMSMLIFTNTTITEKMIVSFICALIGLSLIHI